MKKFDSFGIMGLGGKMETMRNKQKNQGLHKNEKVTPSNDKMFCIVEIF